jgi:hypothetical protein
VTMISIRRIAQTVISTLGIGVVVAGFFVALRTLISRQALLVQNWFIRGLRKRSSLALARILVLREYGERILARDELRYLVVPGQDSQISLPIERAFVPLTLTQDAVLTHPSQLVSEIGPSRILVIGEPGSGKSSLLKREMVRLARLMKGREKSARVPVFLRLGAISGLLDNELPLLPGGLLSAVESECVANAPEGFAALWDEIVDGGRLVILLDGLDEVPLEKFDEIVLLVADLCKELDGRNPDCKVIVSSRPQALLRAARLSEVLPTQLTVERFGLSDIYEFLIRWPFPEQTAGTKSDPKALFEAIGGNPHLKQLCQTPLLLAIYCALVSRSADVLDVPSRRSEFYQRVIRELLHRRLRTNDKPSEVRVARWERFAEEVAYLHILDSDDARNQVSWLTISRAAQALDIGIDIDAGSDFFVEFLVGTGLLREERAGETYYFMHLSFAEFLAARRLARPSPTVVLSMLSKCVPMDSSVQAVLLFVCPLLGKDQRRELLESNSLDVNHLTLIRAYAEAADFEAPGFEHWLKVARADLADFGSLSKDLDSLRIISDVWLQIRPAVEAGDLDPSLDLSLDLEKCFKHATSLERSELLGMLSRSDEYTTWSVLKQLGLSIHDYPDVFVQLMSMPAFLDDFLASASNKLVPDRDLRQLVLLEAALTSRRVAELLRYRTGQIFPTLERNHTFLRSLPKWERNSLLCELALCAPVLTETVSCQAFEAPIARELASVARRTNQKLQSVALVATFSSGLPLVGFSIIAIHLTKRGFNVSNWPRTVLFWCGAFWIFGALQRIGHMRGIATALIRVILNTDRKTTPNTARTTTQIPPKAVSTLALAQRRSYVSMFSSRPSLAVRLVQKAYPGLLELVAKLNRMPPGLEKFAE